MSVALFGIEPWQHYLHATGALQMDAFQRFHGFFKFMMASVLAAGRTFDLPYQVALAIQVAVSLPVLATASWAVRRTADPARRAFVLVAAAPLVTPYVFNYDLTALAAVQVWMLSGRLPWRPEWSMLNLLAWATPLLLMYTNMVGLGIAPLILILMFCASVREARDGPAPAADAGAARWPRPAAA
jgi:hypothetical protein